MKINSQYFVALDIGSSKIAGLVANIANGNIGVITQDLKHSEGLRSGNITDTKKAENSLIEAIYSLEKGFGKNIRQVAISLSGANTKSYYINQKIKTTSGQVSKHDIKKLIQKALEGFKHSNMEIIHYFPVEFNIDNSEPVNNPIGLFGKELECRFHLVAVETNLLTNLTNCFAKYQVEITHVILAIYASGLACLTEEEKQLGTMVVDMGARTTAFGIFLNGELIYTGHVPLGGAHITSDIAKGFGISMQAAEKLKVLHGNAILSTMDKSSIITVEDLDNDTTFHASQNIDAISLTEIINSRAEEILNLLKIEYEKIDIDHLLSNKLVLTGGGSVLRGVKELVSIIFEKRIRVSKPMNLPKFSDNFTPNIYSTLIGMVQLQTLNQHRFSHDYTNSQNANWANWIVKAFRWFKENI